MKKKILIRLAVLISLAHLASAQIFNPTFTGGAPAWAQWLGDGNEGAGNCSGNLNGEHWYSSFTVSNGNTCTLSNSDPLIIRATGTCTVSGTINGRGVDTTNASQNQFGGGASGGSGGGAVAGAAGQNSANPYGIGNIYALGGTAGGTSGGNGTAGESVNASSSTRVSEQAFLTNPPILFGGANGQQGGSSGGTGGKGGGGVILICSSITGTGTIDVSGGYGTPPAANSTGAGSSGGGGVVILSSHSNTFTGSIFVNGGPVVPVSVPAALEKSGAGCTTLPVLTLGVSAGALNSCTVSTAGAGCSNNMSGSSFDVVGGGGSSGTINVTMSGGAVQSCSINAVGSGYTASTFTTAGTGGAGGTGWTKTFSF